MRFNAYGNTPRPKTPKWQNILLIILWAPIVAMLLMGGIVASVEIQSVQPILFFVLLIALFAFLLLSVCYDINYAYIDIADETVKSVSYLFFIRREKTVMLRDIKRVKRCGGYRGMLPYLAFKNSKNKFLFRIDAVPEVISYFENLGFVIEK